MKKTIFAFGILFFVSGCTDAEFSKLTALGNGAEIKCYSGDTLIYSGISTVKVSSEKESDGYFFRDSSDDMLKEVSGNCVITYLK